ncbi:MAG TPA: acetylxylan esterase, partial [Chloroflexota bacterium]|nr:acetylxylan esterase [Chloroflexota bacterium]
MNPVLAGRPEYPRADESYWLYLLRRCRVYAWRRRQELRGFASAADWQRHCASVRDRFRAALGPFPERTPLNPRLVGALERDDYVVEKLLIESQPGFVVTVNLYRPPVVRTPAPAILNPLGHWAQSKAEALVQARGIGLARQGYVALVYDPIGQGERSQFSDAATGAIPIALGTSQHSAACNPCFLIGQTLINYMVWDGVRLLDYLESRPDVDASRIGCTGASGGGTYTMFLTAFDPRIKAAVPVCSTSTYERMLAQGQIGEPCQDPVASYRDDLDVADLLMCAAPTPIQIVAATHDSFPLIGAREAYLDLRDCYTALGVPERAQLVEVPAHHDYSRAMREAAYAWFNRWLSHDGDAIEPPYEPEPAERLWCTATGQVLTSLGGETVLPLNRSRARAIAVPASRLETAAAVAAERDRIREAVAEVLGLATSPPRP